MKVKVTNLNNEAVVGVLGPTLGKFGGGNISGKDGYVSVPSTGVYIIFKRGFRPVLINALKGDPPKMCKLEGLREGEDFGVLYETLEQERKEILNKYYGSQNKNARHEWRLVKPHFVEN